MARFKQPKIEPEARDQLLHTDNEIIMRCKELERQFELFKVHLMEENAQRMEEFCSKHPEVANMRLVDYIEQKRADLIAGKEEKAGIAPRMLKKSIKKEETSSEQNKRKPADSPHKDIKLKITDTNQEAKPKLPDISRLPEVIRLKNVPFRKSKPNEIMVSLSGTPIVMETPKTLIRDMIVSRPTFNARPIEPLLNTEEMDEVD